MPKLNRFSSAKTNVFEVVCSEQSKKTIISTLKAIEGYMMFACISLGMLQMFAMKFGNEIKTSGSFWLRTKTNEIPTEATVIQYLSKNIFRIIEKYKHFSIYQIIQRRQEHCDSEEFSEAS